MPKCGDGVKDLAEGCDDGNAQNDDACLNTCISATCGDGSVQAGVEDCDDGASNSDTPSDACRSNCRPARCGDAVRATNEACDDGNNADNDSCLTPCIRGTCGDGFSAAGRRGTSASSARSCCGVSAASAPRARVGRDPSRVGRGRRSIDDSDMDRDAIGDVARGREDLHARATVLRPASARVSAQAAIEASERARTCGEGDRTLRQGARRTLRSVLARRHFWLDADRKAILGWIACWRLVIVSAIYEISRAT
jgi:cysteine-rich repeat protein